jgi:hypothetical protein
MNENNNKNNMTNKKKATESEPQLPAKIKKAKTNCNNNLNTSVDSTLSIGTSGIENRISPDELIDESQSKKSIPPVDKDYRIVTNYANGQPSANDLDCIACHFDFPFGSREEAENHAINELELPKGIFSIVEIDPLNSQMCARSERQISDETWRLVDIVWYHRCYLSIVAECEDDAKLLPDGVLAYAKKVEARLSKKDLRPMSDFDWGMINGKLSALRWVHGDEWDYLDT